MIIETLKHGKREWVLRGNKGPFRLNNFHKEKVTIRQLQWQ